MKICFVGLGSIARRHIRNLNEISKGIDTDIAIDAVRRQKSIGEAAPKGVSRIFSDKDTLQDDYDVMFITNPTQFHVETLRKYHDNARHFFIEKPIASLQTVGELEELPYRNDSVYYVASPLRFTAVISYLKDNVDLKKVLSVRAISSSYLPEWRPGQDYRATYSAHKSMGGGVDIDLVHEWDYLTFLFGFPNDICHYSGHISPLEIDSNDYAVYIARYDNMVIELHLDYFGRKSIRRIEIYTEEDTIEADMIKGEITYLKSGEIINLNEDRDEFQKKELLYFFDIIKGKKSYYNNIDNAKRVLGLTQGYIS